MLVHCATLGYCKSAAIPLLSPAPRLCLSICVICVDVVRMLIGFHRVQQVEAIIVVSAFVAIMPIAGNSCKSPGLSRFR